MRRFSASAGGNPQFTKTFSLPFVARIIFAFPAIHGSVSSPARRRMRMSSGLLGEDMQDIDDVLEPGHVEDPIFTLRMDSNLNDSRAVESASNHWPNVLTE